jgi:hypothetical protein
MWEKISPNYVLKFSKFILPGVGTSPYQMTFGIPAPVGLASTGLPESVISALTYNFDDLVEDDLELPDEDDEPAAKTARLDLIKGCDLLIPFYLFFTSSVVE